MDFVRDRQQRAFEGALACMTVSTVLAAALLVLMLPGCEGNLPSRASVELTGLEAATLAQLAGQPRHSAGQRRLPRYVDGLTLSLEAR